MKKLLVIAMVSVFAVSAFAVDFTFTGVHEVSGYLANKTEAEDTSHFIYHEALIVGKAQLDAKTTFNFRAYMSDGNYGTSMSPELDVDFVTPSAELSDNPRGNSGFDRFWATYELVDGLKLTVGRTALALTTNTFLQNMWDNTKTVGNPTSDQLRADYKLNNDVALYASYVIRNETENSKDSTLGFLGANLKFADLKVNPVLSIYNAPKERQVAFGAAASYMPASGIQVEGALALNKEMNDDAFDGDKPMVFGLYADVAYVMDRLKAGGFVAYSSADKDNGASYNVSSNWDRTFITDDNCAVDGSGWSGFMQIGAYADFEVMTDLTLSAVASYYMNMTDDGIAQILGAKVWDGVATTGTVVSEDATVIDIEVSAAYKLSDITTVSAGIGYAMASDVFMDIATNEKSDENYIVGFWKLRTVF